MTLRFLSVCLDIEATSTACEPLGWQCADKAILDEFSRSIAQVEALS